MSKAQDRWCTIWCGLCGGSPSPFAARSRSAVIPFLRITLAFLSTLYCQLPRSTFFRFVAIGLNVGLDLGQREEGEKKLGTNKVGRAESLSRSAKPD